MTHTMTTHPLFSASADNRITADGLLIGLRFPAAPLDFGDYADEVTWQLQIRGAVGAPSAWSLDARFVSTIETTFGAQYTNPETAPFTELQTRTFVREQLGWGKPGALPENTLAPKSAGDWGRIADQSDALGGGATLTVTRTVETFTLGHYLELRPQFTGGTNPGIVGVGIIYAKRRA